MRPRRRSGPSTAGPRAQTGIDFMVGMGVFLLAVGFVLGFAPGLFEPFTTSTGSNMLVAERGSAHLAEELLVASPARPGVLDATCTAAFFDDDTAPADCRFETEDLHDALGVGSTSNLNVTIEDGDSVTFAAGDEPGPGQSLIVSRRLVRLDGTEQTLVVRVW